MHSFDGGFGGIILGVYYWFSMESLHTQPYFGENLNLLTKLFKRKKSTDIDIDKE